MRLELLVRPLLLRASSEGRRRRRVGPRLLLLLRGVMSAGRDGQTVRTVEPWCPRWRRSEGRVCCRCDLSRVREGPTARRRGRVTAGVTTP